MILELSDSIVNLSNNVSIFHISVIHDHELSLLPCFLNFFNRDTDIALSWRKSWDLLHFVSELSHSFFE